MDGGAWWAAVHGVAKSRTRLSDFLSLFTVMHWRRKWQPAPVFLPGESQGRGSLWAAIYGVAQSQTQLKRLSSSSKSSEEDLKFQVGYQGRLHRGINIESGEGECRHTSVYCSFQILHFLQIEGETALC